MVSKNNLDNRIVAFGGGARLSMMVSCCSECCFNFRRIREAEACCYIFRQGYPQCLEDI